MDKTKRKSRWQRLLQAHRDRGRPYMTSWAQAHAIGSVTISKVRHEATLNGWRWQTRRDHNGNVEYRPIRMVGGAYVTRIKAAR